MLNQLLYYSVLLSWALNIFFLARFLLAWVKSETKLPGTALALAAVCLPALALTLLLTVRGGYDNDHDFMCLGTRFLTLDPTLLLKFKELSPLFTDSLSDLLGRYSLASLLWKNRLLMGLSALVFFAGLRRLGAGRAVSVFSSAFLFLNFLAPVNANSFSTTASNLFIWLCALAAIFDAAKSPAITAGRLLWIYSSLVLLVAARFELLPAAVLVLLAALVSKPKSERAGLLCPRNLALTAVFLCVLGAWTVHITGFSPEKQISGRSFSPLMVLSHQLGRRNFSLIAGHGAGSPGVSEQYPSGPWVLANRHIWPPLLFLALAAAGALAGGFAGKNRLRRNALLLAALGAWILYFLRIYLPVDRYPLHFMRHQLYFLVPFAYLFALGLDGFAAFLASRAANRRLFLAAGSALMGAYAALNAGAALSLNGERRTNDIELEFLLRARLDWDPACAAVYNEHDSRYPLLARYFPLEGDGQTPSACRLEYVSAYPKIFAYSGESPLTPKPAVPAPAGKAWREFSFKHAFYTTTTRGGGLWMETMEPLPLTIGFYRTEAPPRVSARAPASAGPVFAPADAAPFSRAPGIRRALPARTGENDPGAGKAGRVIKVMESGPGAAASASVKIAPGERWRILWKIEALDARVNAELKLRVESDHNYQELIKEILPAESGVSGYMNVLDHVGGEYRIVVASKKAAWRLEAQVLE